jgi:hypothetical protein
MADAALDRAIVDALWSDADALLARGTMIKDGDRCTLVELAHNGRRYVLKRFNRRGPVHMVLHLLLRSRARWCWVNAARVRALGLRTPRSAAMFETRFGPFRDRSFHLCEFIDGRILQDVVRDEAHAQRSLALLADRFTRIWRLLGQSRLGHRDMKATNFIVDPDHQLWLIDLDAMRWYPPGPLFARRRRKDLARFMKNWRDQPEAEAAFRARIDSSGPLASGSSTAAAARGAASSATGDQSRS